MPGLRFPACSKCMNVPICSSNKSQHLWMWTDRTASAELEEEWRHVGKYLQAPPLSQWTQSLAGRSGWGRREQGQPAQQLWNLFQALGCSSEDSNFFLQHFATISLLGTLEAGTVWVKRNLHQGLEIWGKRDLGRKFWKCAPCVGLWGAAFLHCLHKHYT